MTEAPPTPPFEQQKWVHEMKRDDAYRAFDWQDSRLRMLDQAAIKSGDAALRAGLLINGGAAISVLAFMGSLAAKDLVPISRLSRVADSLVVFAWGVIAAVVGLGLSYLTHLFEGMHFALLKPPFTEPSPASKRNLWFRNTAHILAIVVFFLCIGFFVCGMISVRNAVGGMR
jgi:hypothetical protein